MTALGHTVAGRQLFTGLELIAHQGEVHTLTGPSGVGKSTLLRMIGGLERPSTGSIRALDQQITRLRGATLRRYLRHSVGFVFQDGGLVEEWTVRKNIAAAAAAASRTPTSAPMRIDAAVDRVNLPSQILDRRAGELSGGERQRVSIARILVRKPPLVIMDEPTAALDPRRTRLVTEILRDLADEGAIVLVASHDSTLADASDAQSALLDLNQWD